MNHLRKLSLKPGIRGLAFAVLWIIAGCVTKPAEKSGFVFFPAPPDEPRIQYLTAFGSENDLDEPSKFTDYILGAEKVSRPIWKPYGVAVTKGTIYVCDTQAGNLGVVDLEKRKIRYIRPGGREAMQTPINVAVDNDGNRYVTDPKRGQVLIYGKDDQRVGEIGKAGEMKPCGIFVAGDRLYVTDLLNHCVRVYNLQSRQLLLTVPPTQDDEKSRLHSPTNIGVDSEGLMYVSDTGGFTTKVYDGTGNHIRTVGELGLEAGRFALPKGIAVDHEKRMYVVDAATAIVQIFDANGQLLMYFGEPQSSGPAGLYLPAGIAIDYENIAIFRKYVAPGFKLEYLIFITNQAGPQKVSVYGFIKKG
jgi:DNA-binding beta-propeller fold protein YncE